MMRAVRLKACTLLCWLLVLNAVAPAFSKKNTIRAKPSESDRNRRLDQGKGKGESDAAALVASVEGLVQEMKAQPVKRATELGLEGELTQFASIVKKNEIARFEEKVFSADTINKQQLAENFHAEGNETDKLILKIIGENQAQLSDDLGAMAKGIEVAKTLVSSRATGDENLQAKAEIALNDAEHLVFDFRRQQKALTKKFDAPVCCAVEVDETKPQPLQKLVGLISSALQIEMNRLALQYGFDVLVNGTSKIEIVTDSRRHLQGKEGSSGTLLKVKVEQQLSCSTNCKPHDIYNEDSGRYLLENSDIIQKTLNARVQEYVTYELEDNSEVDCTSCGAWNWETSDFGSHVSSEDYEDVEEFVHAESLLMAQEFERDTQLEKQLEFCRETWAETEKNSENNYLLCAAKNLFASREIRNQCMEDLKAVLDPGRRTYTNCIDKANWVHSSTQSSLLTTYENLEREVSKGITEVFSTVNAMVIEKFDQIVDHAKAKKEELIQFQLAVAKVVEEEIACVISGAMEGEYPSTQDLDLMSTLFEFSLNSAYREAKLNKEMVDFAFYESCFLDETTLECVDPSFTSGEEEEDEDEAEDEDQPNRQLRKFKRKPFKITGNGNANASDQKNLKSDIVKKFFNKNKNKNKRSLTSIKKDPTRDAVELEQKSLEVHRRMNDIDEDFFVQHVNTQFGALYMKVFPHLLVNATDASVHCSLQE